MPSKNSPSVSIVIPNYNGVKILGPCLQSALSALSYANLQGEVIVSDDHSSDDSVSFIAENFPQVKLITNDHNLGFAGNINRGLRATTMDLVFAMNSDLTLEKDYFIEQLAYFEDDRTFAVMGALRDAQSKKNLPISLYPQQNFWGITQTHSVPNYEYDKPIPIFFASGSNSLMCRQKLMQLQYFSELYNPYYGEDNDLGLKAWRMGWRSYYHPTSHCYHLGSSTIKASSNRKKVRLISRRNKLIFHYFHLQGWQSIVFQVKILLDLLTRMFIFDFQYYRAFLMFLKLLPMIQREKITHSFLYSTAQTIHYIQNKMHP